VSAVQTVGRWPWKLGSAKKCVIAYPPNRGGLKMDGAYLLRDAPDALRGRLARMYLRRKCVSVSGGVCGADLGSSSMFLIIVDRAETGSSLEGGDAITKW